MKCPECGSLTKYVPIEGAEIACICTKCKHVLNPVDGISTYYLPKAGVTVSAKWMNSWEAGCKIGYEKLMESETYKPYKKEEPVEKPKPKPMRRIDWDGPSKGK